MKAKNIEVVLRRAKSSRTLQKMENYDFPVLVNTLTISENAPCSIRRNGAYPAQMGWTELLSRDLSSLPHDDAEYDIWVKTATLGGRRRIWIRKNN